MEHTPCIVSAFKKTSKLKKEKAISVEYIVLMILSRVKGGEHNGSNRCETASCQHRGEE